MNLLRYVVLKNEGAVPPADEEEYERNSDCFITTCTTRPPSDFETGPFAAVRYGVEDLFGQNYHVLDDITMTWGFPIHDSCWQIFQRVSMLRLRVVDLQGLFALWEVNVP